MTKTTNELELLRSWTGYQVALRKIAKALHHLDECACNYGLTQRQEARERKLEAEADRIGAFFGLKAYHQRDPRGGTLYFVPAEWTFEYTNSHYHDGIYIER